MGKRGGGAVFSQGAFDQQDLSDPKDTFFPYCGPAVALIERAGRSLAWHWICGVCKRSCERSTSLCSWPESAFWPSWPHVAAAEVLQKPRRPAPSPLPFPLPLPAVAPAATAPAADDK